jgi:succinoglycan biosynthesis transport protein ExoP
MDVPSRRIDIDYAESGASDDAPAVASIVVLVEQLTGFVRRQYQVFIIVPAAAIALGLLYLLLAPAQYTATATLLIDSSSLRVLQNRLQPLGDTPLDASQVGSQVEILRSEKIARAVIKSLDLIGNPEFVKPGAGTFAVISALFSSATPDPGPKTDMERRALDEFVSHRSIARVERTNALEIAYTSQSPVIAAKIANAIADAYIDDQLEAKYQTTRRASAWLQDRISELKAQATSADRAVLEFKEKNNIVDFGGLGGTGAPGASSRLIGEQQLFELNSQLGIARGATSEARARLERIEQVRKLDVGEAAVADTLRNEVITRLRNQYLDLSAREANWSTRYGRDHLAAINLRDQMEELRRNIAAELGRIAASYQSDYEIAKAREENLVRTLGSLVSEGQVTNRDRLGLTELESSAKIYHAVYDNFFQHYMEAIQQQSFPITDARVISSAAPPSQKSKPVGSLVLAIAGTMGIVLSLGIAGLREAIDGVFRTARQAELALRVKCLSVVPLVTAQIVPASAPGTAVARRSRPYGDAWRAPGQPTEAIVSPDTTCYALADPLMRRVVDEPFSAFTEAFRAIKVTAELQAVIRDNKVIGITSTLPNEGKSTIACNLAMLMADAGKRVILMDTDLRNPTLARSLTPRPTAGLMELLTGRIDLQQALGRERATGLTLLPLVLDEQIVHADEILSSQAFRNLIDQLRQRYDYVIMDLPPIAPVVDVRATVPVVDSLVFVVEWGSTKIKTVQRHLMTEPELHDRLLGVVLNKANLKVLERFEDPGLYQNGYSVNHGYRQSPHNRPN